MDLFVCNFDRRRGENRDLAAADRARIILRPEDCRGLEVISFDPSDFNWMPGGADREWLGEIRVDLA